MHNPFQTNLRFENFFKFFFLKKHQFFSLFRTLYCKGEKHEVRKKSFLVLFYSAKSISVQFTIWELFQVFFSKKHQFFSLFRTLYCKGEKHEVRKKSFLVLFKVQNPFQTNLRFENFFKFFQKIKFFTVSNPIWQRWEAWGQKKISFSALL